MTRDDARALMQQQSPMRLLWDSGAVCRPGHLDVVRGGDHVRMPRVVDRGHRECQLGRFPGIEPISIPFERHGDEHRRIACEPSVAIAARDFSRKPSRVFGRVLRDASAMVHGEQRKNTSAVAVKISDSRPLLIFFKGTGFFVFASALIGCRMSARRSTANGDTHKNSISMGVLWKWRTFMNRIILGNCLDTLVQLPRQEHRSALHRSAVWNRRRKARAYLGQQVHTKEMG